ncbi:60S ribosomal protein L18a-like protein [Phalaenopsis equestris]|uniref:60S ribosomal protein L18a-like protein n=1 Tax=Phalaenopsis equestris TaxID=78828 RepID=UPI0009E2E384|nr:60S ribosomal protein L18a-like protein [Phalaenopsis equestris]
MTEIAGMMEREMMGAKREDCDPSKVPVQTPCYGTFAQPAVPPVAPPRSFPHFYHQLPPVPPAAYQAIPVIPVGYQSIPYAIVAEGIPVRERRLPCGGIGIGWVLFLSGFLLAAVPWYVGALIFVIGALDKREKPGLVACTVAAVLATVPISFKTFFDYFS